MTIAEAITKLHDFKSSQEVADYLKSQGIKGNISRPAEDVFLKCPIDRLIKQWTDEEVATGMKDVLDYNHGHRYDLPQSVVDFNRDFALSKYPYLIAMFPRGIGGIMTSYIHENGRELFVFERQCSITKEIFILKLPADRVMAWANGMLIQNAFPQLSPSQREFLITGLTPAEQDKLS